MNLLDIFFPRRCVSCGKLGKYFCPSCRLKIKLFQTPICPVCGRAAIDGATHPVCRTRYTIDGLTSFFQYWGPVRAAIKKIKYRLVSHLSEEFISLIPASSLYFFTKPSTPDSGRLILIPVPLHPGRFKFRGFNQSEVLGRLLAKKLGIPVVPGLLMRTRKTTPQVEVKDRDKRIKNMEGVFTVNPKVLTSQYLPAMPAGSLAGKAGPDILLFDDVFTTGATLCSAANVLKRAGVRKVWGLVLAHG